MGCLLRRLVEPGVIHDGRVLSRSGVDLGAEGKKETILVSFSILSRANAQPRQLLADRNCDASERAPRVGASDVSVFGMSTSQLG